MWTRRVFFCGETYTGLKCGNDLGRKLNTHDHKDAYKSTVKYKYEATRV